MIFILIKVSRVSLHPPQCRLASIAEPWDCDVRKDHCFDAVERAMLRASGRGSDLGIVEVF